MIIQRSDEWYQARLGKATASRFADIMATGYNGKPLAAWKNYKAELVVERLTGKPTETFQSGPMLWGIENEPLAALYYTMATGNSVEECGFFNHPDIENAGASPDRLIAPDGTVEIKCPNTATHLETLHSQEVPRMYMWQGQGQLWVTGRKWFDFVSFDPRLPENARLFIKRVQRDDALIEQLEGRVKQFLKEVDDEIEFVQKYKNEGEK